jgi:DNA polymerase
MLRGMARGASHATAADYLPGRGASLRRLAAALPRCRGCELWQNGTTPVFGEGPARARLVLVGEQPGDRESREGRPFVGPAGRLLDEALAAAGIARGDTWLTNVVKHFRFRMRGKRRMHAAPTVEHVRSCVPWLEAELARVEPRVVVALGATAAKALLGPAFRVSRQHGELVTGTRWAPTVVATVHPSAVVRRRGEDDFQEALDAFVDDLRVAAAAVRA